MEPIIFPRYKLKGRFRKKKGHYKSILASIYELFPNNTPWTNTLNFKIGFFKNNTEKVKCNIF